MYLSYFHFKEEPFSITPDPRFLMPFSHHEGVLDTLLYGIEHQKGFMLLTGEVGTGKTTLCRALVGQLPSQISVSVILNPLLSVLGLLKSINKDFGIDEASNAPEDQLGALNSFLLNQAKNNQNALVIIDEAQNMAFESLEMIRLLSNIETDSHKLLQVLLVGQPELELMLNSYQLRQLNQRIVIRQKLGALNLEQMKAYIEHRLFIASGKTSLISFQPKALKRLYHYSAGYPRLINVICDRVLLLAYAQQSREVTPKMVQQATQDIKGSPIKQWWRFW